MIGRLRGTLVRKQPPWLMIEVGGVGYELEAPMSTIYDLPGTGQEITLLTHYAVREDVVALYGFLREDERSLFRDLHKVTGIGAKIALAVLSGVSCQELSRLVQAGDLAALSRIPGIGKKTAERMVVELRDRVAGLGASLLAGKVSQQALSADPAGEATIALQQLGYKPAEATRLVLKVAIDSDTAETIIRKALRAALGN